MKSFYDTFPTAVGDFSVAVNADSAVVATAFGGAVALSHRLGCTASDLDHAPARALLARRQIRSYFARELHEFDLPLAPAGTVFQHRVWAALQRIPFGMTRSYGQIAATLGNPAASRAVGRANATNPICLVIPCHRVIGADGSLTGFAFGEDLKRRLLAHEGATAFRDRAAKSQRGAVAA